MWFEACVLSCLTMIFYVLYSSVCYTFIFVSSFHLPHTPSSLRPHAVFVSPKRATRHYCPRAEIGRSYRRRV